MVLWGYDTLKNVNFMGKEKKEVKEICISKSNYLLYYKNST